MPGSLFVEVPPRERERDVAPGIGVLGRRADREGEERGVAGVGLFLAAGDVVGEGDRGGGQAGWEAVGGVGWEDGGDDACFGEGEEAAGEDGGFVACGDLEAGCCEVYGLGNGGLRLSGCGV